MTEGDAALKVESDFVLDSINPISWVKTAREIRRWKPDLVLTRYWMPFFAPSLGWVLRSLRKSCKVISILDNDNPHKSHFFDKPLTRYFLQGSDAFITLCSAVGEDLKALKPDARYEVLPHPLYNHFGEPIQRFLAEKRLDITPGMRNILFFGLIRDYKGLDVLMQAFGMLGPEYQLIVAGEPYGSFDKYDKILVDLEEAAQRVQLHLNYVDDAHVAEYFSAADLVVLPYKSATQSGISAISYHFGVPMVVTNVGGLKEAIGDRGTGLVAGECTPQSVKNEIVKYFASPELQSQCKENIQSEKDRLSWSRFAQNLVSFAQKIEK